MNLQRRLREHLKHYAAANEAADRIDELEAQLSARCSADSAVEGKRDAIVQLIHKHIGVRQRVNVDLTGVEDAADAILRNLNVPQTAPSDIERAFRDACDEAGCAYDNEALLEAIHALKERCQEDSSPQTAPELTATCQKLLPGGIIDDATYAEIEDALDRAEAPSIVGGRWLKLHERIAALAAERPAASAEPQSQAGIAK
jgi:hypothetical protein